MENEINPLDALLAQTALIQSLACALHHTGQLHGQTFHRYLNLSEQTLAQSNPAALEVFQQIRRGLDGLLQSVDAARP